MDEVLSSYDTLGVGRDADLTAIEDAYDSLFDRYEPQAQAGDQYALAMLHRLNNAREVLIDPAKRAELDRRLSVRAAPARATKEVRQPAAKPRSAKAAAVNPESDAQSPARPGKTSQRQQPANQTIRTRRRSYERATVEPRRAFGLLTYIIIAVVILAIGSAAILFANKGPQCQPPPDPPAGQVVATINGVPIYAREFEEQANLDKERAANDSMVMALIGSFDTITGTRFIDGLSYDALDKRMNMEVIQQEAKKEGLYPTDAQIPSLIQEAKANELKPGESFECFLQRVGVSEAQYNRKVIENVVYVAMANKHLPAEGNADKRTAGFITWMCEARKKYDVQPKLTFAMKENQPCTSGLPSDITLPGLDQTPEAELTEVPLPITTPEPPLTSTSGLATPAPVTRLVTILPFTPEPTPQPTSPETITAP